MKKSLLALAIGAVIATPVMAEDKGPTLYGKLNLSLDQIDLENNDDASWSLNSNASRLGVKGSNDLNGDLEVIYKLEYQVDADDGSTVFSQRNIYAGLKGGFGTVKAGHFDTPLKKAQGKFDQFNDYQLGDIKNIISGEGRSQNLIQYSSPTLADAFTVNVALQPGEESDTQATCTASPDSCDDNGLADGLIASVVYQADAIYASLAIAQDNNDEDLEFTSNNDKQDITRAVVGYKGDNFGANVLFQQAEETDEPASTDANEESAFGISGYFNVSEELKLKLQYIAAEFEGRSYGAETDENTQLALGADYKLGKKTKAFVYLVNEENDSMETGANATDDKVFGLGLDHKF